MLWKKIFKKSLILAFTFFAVDVRKIKRRGSVFSPPSIFKEIEKEQVRRKERKKTRLYKNKKWQKRKDYREKNLKYSGTKSRDHRYSNQKTLRRMYRNV